ncbi:alpha-2-macroglobulin-like protein 1 isoform X2 [Pelobates fuscus]|uniref:alpha-2-macroglobulin-like protein 1 isoform X2 n=1 Tax=Pelobates fuscus TaxID=191477 RepID=UPI002FE451C1
MMWTLPLLLYLGSTLVQTQSNNEPYFGLFLPSVLYYPSDATFCIHMDGNSVKYNLTINLKSESGITNLRIVKDASQSPFYCDVFQVPPPSGTQEKVQIEVRGQTSGDSSPQISSKSVSIRRKTNGTFIQTDKPIYKPGQKVNFRIVTLNQDLETSNEKYPLIELQDPQRNRLAQWKDVQPNSGIADLSFQLSPEPALGTYTIKTEEMKYIFTVEEYVLPRFEVSLKTPSSITVLDSNATMTTCARYTFGQPVPGTVTLKICQNSRWSHPWRWGPSRQEGEKNVCHLHTAKNDHSGCLKSTVDLSKFQMQNPGYDRKLVVEAFLEEEGTGITINATSQQCDISSQLTKISFKDSKSYFQPGAPYRGKLVLESFNGKPLSGQKVHLTTFLKDESITETFTTDSAGEVSFQLSTSKWGADSVSLKAFTDEKDEDYKRDRIAARYGTSYLYLEDIYVKSQDSVYIHPIKSAALCHENMAVRVDYDLGEKKFKGVNKANKVNEVNEVNDENDLKFFYVVMSHVGKILYSGQKTVSQEKADSNIGILYKGQKTVSQEKADSRSGSIEISLPVRDVSPNGKILVFTSSDDGEVAADTATFQVTACLKQNVTLGFSEDQVLPGSLVKLNLRAAAGSLCALRVVDKSVTLMKPEDELTEAKIQNLIKTVPHYPSYKRLDFGFCRNNGPSKVFDPWWHQRRSYPVRKKDLQNIIEEMGLTIVTNWKIEAPVTCKLDRGVGMMAKSMPSASLMRAPAAASSRTLAYLESADAEYHDESFAEPEDEVSSDVSEDVRTHFPETLLWKLQPIPSSGSMETELKVPDSITEWSGQMFCTGAGSFALSKPTTLNVFKPYFVEMTLPYSIKRGETFVLKASLYNYLQECMQTEVTLIQSEDLRLKGTDKNIHNICLCAGEKKTVSWPVTLTSTGHKNITVSSQALSSKDTCSGQETKLIQKGQKDIVINSLLVEPEGTLVEQTHNSLLICYGSSVEEKVKLDLPETYVEGSAKASINVFGDLMSSALNNLDNLLAMSYGCGEQNMVRFAPNVYIMQYLDSSQQLSDEMRKKGKDFLTKGYQRQLTYKHKAGCYSAFGESDKEGNTWLTAFVLKSFKQAQNFILIDEEHLNNGIKWMEKQQRSDGCFKASGHLLNNALKGGVDDEVSLTSYVLAALMEGGMSPDNPMVDRGMQCLKNASLEEASTYKMALMAYAYTLADLPDARAELLQKLDSRAIKADGSTHWTQASKAEPDNFWSKPNSVDIELTSYVLLSKASAKQVSTKELGEMVAIMRWLSKQQNAKGGFRSTQDTVVALQALAKFGLLTFSKDGNVTVTVSSENGFQQKLHVDDSNRLILQRTSLPQIPGEYTITATGVGSVYVQVIKRYHTPPPDREATFNLSVVTQCTKKDLLEIAVEFWYQGVRPSTNMVLVDVKMISGYVPQKESIEKLKKKSTVKRVETNEDSVIIYIEEVTSQPQVLKFIAERKVEVTDLKPAILRIYDYYMPEEEKIINYLSICT